MRFDCNEAGEKFRRLLEHFWFIRQRSQKRNPPRPLPTRSRQYRSAVRLIQLRGNLVQHSVGCHWRNIADDRSEEHTSELQSLMRISYAVFCLKKKNNTKTKHEIIKRMKTHQRP